MVMLHDAWKETWAQVDRELARYVMRAISIIGQAAAGSAFRRLLMGFERHVPYNAGSPLAVRVSGSGEAASGATRCLLQRSGDSLRRWEWQAEPGCDFGGRGCGLWYHRK